MTGYSQALDDAIESAAAAAEQFGWLFGAGLGDLVREYAPGAICAVLAVAIPAQSGAADELEYYAGPRGVS